MWLRRLSGSSTNQVGVSIPGCSSKYPEYTDTPVCVCVDVSLEKALV